DDTRDWDAIVPDSFTVVQWTRLPRGETPAAFCDRVKALVSGNQMEPVRFPPEEHGERAASPSKRRSPLAWIAGGVLALAAIALVVWRPWDATRSGGPSTTRAASAEFPRDPDLKRAY